MSEYRERHDRRSGLRLGRRPLVGGAMLAPLVSLLGGRTGAPALASDDGPSAQDLGLPAFNSAISILDNGPANPYGSLCAVTGMKGKITDVNLILKGFRHDRPSDVSIMLAHAGRAAIVMRGAGGETAVRDANILLNDQAAAALPEDEPLEGGRAYKPADYDPGRGPFGGSAPGPSSGSPALATFNDLSPNGQWVLWVRDDRAAIGGGLSGWQLVIVTDQPAGNYIVIDNYGVRAGRTLSVDRQRGLLARDDAGPSSGFQVRVVERPGKGRLRLHPDGSFTYRPRRRRGRDFFTYTITDEFGSVVQGTGRVNIRIRS
jgi:hypothetical protein